MKRPPLIRTTEDVKIKLDLLEAWCTKLIKLCLFVCLFLMMLSWWHHGEIAWYSNVSSKLRNYCLIEFVFIFRPWEISRLLSKPCKMRRNLLNIQWTSTTKRCTVPWHLLIMTMMILRYSCWAALLTLTCTCSEPSIRDCRQWTAVSRWQARPRRICLRLERYWRRVKWLLFLPFSFLFLPAFSLPCPQLSGGPILTGWSDYCSHFFCTAQGIHVATKYVVLQGF